MTNYKVSIKIDGKWNTVGTVKENKWGNMTLGLMKKPEVLAALQGDGWANFSLFEDDGARREKPAEAVASRVDDEIPFN